MIPLLDSEKMARLDRHTIENIGLPGAVLMETAGRGVVRHLCERFNEQADRGGVVVVCGRGNNGGDGFVVARCLLNGGFGVRAVLLAEQSQVTGDAALHMNAYLAAGGELSNGEEVEPGQVLGDAAVVVDAIFGTGLKRAVDGDAAAWIEAINRSGAAVVSVDMPSGVSSDNGNVLGTAVEADLTVTFGFRKKGQYIYPGAAHCGEVALVDIGIPPEALRVVLPSMYLFEECDFAGTLMRGRESHKGDFGHLALLAGGRGKMGAAGLAAIAALKSGAGLSSALFPAGLTSEARFAAEVMTGPIGTGSPGPTGWSPALFDPAMEIMGRTDAAVVGPGMGVNADVESFVELIVSAEERPPLVLDADALTILARRPDLRPAVREEDIMTPHPGEAARLLGVDSSAVQTDRQEACTALADKWGCVVVLKGAGTLVKEPHAPIKLANVGNPGMATAGSGDVLAGVAGAFLARGMPSHAAAAAAVYAHGLAGDLAAAEVGEEGLTAQDILNYLPRAMKRLAAC